jgi:hypothetical protein
MLIMGEVLRSDFRRLSFGIEHADPTLKCLLICLTDIRRDMSVVVDQFLNLVPI